MFTVRSNNLPCARLLYIHGSRLDLMDYKHRLPEDRTRDGRVSSVGILLVVFLIVDT